MRPNRTFRVLTVLFVITLAIHTIPIRAQDPGNGEIQSISVNDPATATDPVASRLNDATVPKDVPEFIPTNEWQTILPGQSIPPGLWVRMNVYEGTREARLLPPTEAPAPKTHRPTRKHHTTEAPTAASATTTTTDDKKATLLLPQPSGDTIVQPPPRPSRSIEELKADLAELSHLFQPIGDSVMERVHALLNVTSTTSTNDIILILQDLEEMTHQIDHAVDMYTAGGLAPLLDMISQDGLILRDRNINDILNIRYYAVWLLGVTANNNPTTSKQARDAGAISSLIHLFIHPTTPHPHDATHHDSIRKLQSKIIFALSSLLRNSAEGQDLASTSDIWQQFHTHLFPHAPITKYDITLRDKILILISDMLSDRLVNGAHMGMENVSSTRLFDILTSETWCHTYGTLLSEIDKETDTKWISTVVEMTSMLMEGKVCASWVTPERVTHARQIGQRLAILSAEDDVTKQDIDLVINGADADSPTAPNADEYQSEMADLTRELISAIALVDEPQQPIQQQEL